MRKPLILLAYTWLIFGAFHFISPTSAPPVTEIKEDPTTQPPLPLSFQYEEVKLEELGID